MSWPEFLSRLLQSSSKVDRAAVFNTRGHPVAATDGVQVSEADGVAILHCLHDPARTITRIALDNTDFRCFQGNNNALVGMATGGTGRVMVARLTEEALVVVMGRSSRHGSMLFEVQQNLVDRTRRQLAPQAAMTGGAGEGSQQAATQQKKLLVRPPSAVTQEQVLVQLHD